MKYMNLSRKEAKKMSKINSVNQRKVDGSKPEKPPISMNGPGKMDWKTAKRILSYLKQYKAALHDGSNIPDRNGCNMDL